MNKKLLSLLLAVSFLLTACTVGTSSGTETDPSTVEVTRDDSYTAELTEIRTNVKERENRPTEFSRGSSYDELIFYDEDSTESSLNEDAEWRSEALARIDEIRKGDISVIAVDSWGVPLSDVKVDIEMYEHEFEWGTAVNQNILNDKRLQENVGRCTKQTGSVPKR